MEFIELDVDEYVKELTSGDGDGQMSDAALLHLVEEIRTLVVKHEKKAKELELKIPQEKCINMFRINCGEIREQVGGEDAAAPGNAAVIVRRPPSP